MSEPLDVKGWQVKPEGIRELATKIGIPTTQSLPEVVIVGKEADERVQAGPQLYTDSSRTSPSGFFITIPESMLKKVSETEYIFGPRIREDIRHELAHFIEHLETGTETGREEDPYSAAAKEIRADLRAGVRRPFMALAMVMRTLKEDYGLSFRDSSEIVGRAASDLGVSAGIIRRAKRTFREGRVGWIE